MGWFSRRSKSEMDAIDALVLLLNDKVDQMANVDALVNLLTRKGIFTMEEFHQMKQTIKETDQYKQVYRLADTLAEALNPAMADAGLSVEDLDDLIESLSENNETGEKNKNE